MSETPEQADLRAAAYLCRRAEHDLLADRLEAFALRLTQPDTSMPQGVGDLALSLELRLNWLDDAGPKPVVGIDHSPAAADVDLLRRCLVTLHSQRPAAAPEPVAKITPEMVETALWKYETTMGDRRVCMEAALSEAIALYSAPPPAASADAVIEQCAKLVEGDLVFERYRTWPCWRPIENRGSASEVVKLTTAIAKAIRALSRSPNRSPQPAPAQETKP